MSNFELSRPKGATLKTLVVVSMAGTIAGCSSDLSRFSYNQAINDGQLTTASVNQPFSNDLAPVGSGGPQSFPGDSRAPSASPIYTASIPTSTVRAPTNLYQTTNAPKQVSVVRETLPTPAQNILPRAQPPIVTGSIKPTAQVQTFVPMKLDTMVTGSSAPVPGVRTGVVRLEKQTAPIAVPSNKPTNDANVYTVSSGDTLNRVAYKHGVSVSALQSANGLTNSSIRIGQKLNIPGKSFKVMAPDDTMTASIPEKQSKVKQVAEKKVSTQRNDELTKTAKIEADVVTPKKTGIDKLRWPAKGQIETSFGGKTDAGKRNDGIDILMPEGSAIKAAENGVVIYADSGLKGFGNTVLVRHDDDLVTVYAHARSLNVSRGNKVTRGQVVAQSGMSGSAKRPKLHFEVRHKAVPKNPILYLE